MSKIERPSDIQGLLLFIGLGVFATPFVFLVFAVIPMLVLWGLDVDFEIGISSLWIAVVYLVVNAVVYELYLRWDR